MNMKIKATKVDLTNARLESITMDDQTFTLIIDSQEEKSMRIVFFNPIQFSYNIGNIIQDLYQLTDDPPFLRKAMSLIYEKIPDVHPFKLFQLIDINDFPFIEIVAESVQVIPKGDY